MEKKLIDKLVDSADIDYYIQRLKELFYTDRTDLYLDEVCLVGSTLINLSLYFKKLIFNI